MDIIEAKKLFGFSENHNFTDAYRKYRELVKKHHPDKSELSNAESNKIMRRIIQSWEIIKENYNAMEVGKGLMSEDRNVNNSIFEESKFGFRYYDTKEEEMFSAKYLRILRERLARLKIREKNFYNNTYSIEAALLLLHSYVEYGLIEKVISLWESYIEKRCLPFLSDVLSIGEICDIYQYMPEAFSSKRNYSRALDFLIISREYWNFLRKKYSKKFVRENMLKIEPK